MEKSWLSDGGVYVMDFFYFSSRRLHTIFDCDWSSDVCSSDLHALQSRALQPDRVRPATAGEGDDRLRAGNRALQRSLRGLIADGLTHRTRGELHEVLFQHAHRRLQLEQVRLL